ncbi:MAG: NadS family protein [Proteobacteria bacterium]|nr:NadS family protein [Pseudomonadota bacterium]
MADKFNKTESSILKGLQEAVSYSIGDKEKSVEHKVKLESIDVKEEREKLGLSQEAFADAFGVSVSTVRNWEQKRRTPRGAAKVLLNVIHNNPDAVIDAIR